MYSVNTIEYVVNAQISNKNKSYSFSKYESVGNIQNSVIFLSVMINKLIGKHIKLG